MSVPLDNLYYWVRDQTRYPVALYVFRPHGSKKISDLDLLDNMYYPQTFSGAIPMVCYDQEPLNYNLYENFDFEKDKTTWAGYSPTEKQRSIDVYKSENLHNKNLHMVPMLNDAVYYDCSILLHSEKNSQDLIRYQQEGFVCVHYWCHAIIARDWFRYAQHDNKLAQVKEPTIDFLIHARDWSGTREYRLKFLEMMADADLTNQSKITFQTEVDGNNFNQHLFQNKNFQIDYNKLTHVVNQSISSNASATYDADDYNDCMMSVVLETMFDSSKIHLTEKICRALACGHAFILAAGPGSLQYLRDYGFKTFSNIIDESYDEEPNSLLRLQKIVEVMTYIKSLPPDQKIKLKNQFEEVANYNRRWFFDDEFHKIIANELQSNLDAACVEMKNHIGNNYRKIRLAKKKQRKPSADVLQSEKKALSWIRKNRQVKQISL
jgi:hypothetical protein